MSTMRWELPAPTLELPVVREPVREPVLEPVLEPEPVSPAAGTVAASARSRPRLRRSPALLAPTLPALVLLGLCIAGLTDPPEVPKGGSGSVSRLHVPTEAPRYPPSVPLQR